MFNKKSEEKKEGTNQLKYCPTIPPKKNDQSEVKDLEKEQKMSRAMARFKKKVTKDNNAIPNPDKKNDVVQSDRIKDIAATLQKKIIK